jgi:hypothetical protein
MQRKLSYQIALAGAAFKARFAITLLGMAFISATPIAAAQDISLSTLTTCQQNGRPKQNIVYVGRTMKGQLKGNWADWITAVSTNRPLITTTFSNPVGNWSNSTMDVVFRVKDNYDWSYDVDGSVDVKVAPPLQPSYSKSVSPRFFVIGAPALTAVSVPRADFYQTVDVTLTGTNLNGANVATAIAKVDLSHPVVGYGGEAAQIANGTSIPAALVGTPTKTQAVVRLSLPQKLTRISVDTKLSATNASTCTPFGTGPGTEASPTVSRRVTLAVPAPAAMPNIQSAALINAKVGSDAEFTITLNKPVPFPVSAPRVLTAGERAQPGQVLDPFGAMAVYWKMAPSNVFSGISGGVSYDASGGFNRVTMNPGESVKRFKLRVVSLPAGAVNVGTVYLQTWIGDKTRNEAPYFFQKEFTIVK